MTEETIVKETVMPQKTKGGGTVIVSWEPNGEFKVMDPWKMPLNFVIQRLTAWNELDPYIVYHSGYKNPLHNPKIDHDMKVAISASRLGNEEFFIPNVEEALSNGKSVWVSPDMFHLFFQAMRRKNSLRLIRHIHMIDRAVAPTPNFSWKALKTDLLVFGRSYYRFMDKNDSRIIGFIQKIIDDGLFQKQAEEGLHNPRDLELLYKAEEIIGNVEKKMDKDLPSFNIFNKCKELLFFARAELDGGDVR